MASKEAVRLGLLLFPQFSLMAFSAALEPLRAANRLLGHEYYQWVVLSPDGAAVVLAEAGLLDGRQCTVHWEYSEFFADRYPRARLRQDVFVVDRGVFTCSGGTAALDMMLHFIREHHGQELALAVADQFIHPRIREQGDRQRMAVHTRYRITSSKLADVIELMEQTSTDLPALGDIAARVSLSARQVERLFQRHLGTSPGEFHLSLRLARARTLLRDTSQPVRAIAAACGFKSTSHFSSSYRRAYRRRPTDERRPPASQPRNKASAPRKRSASRIDTML